MNMREKQKKETKQRIYNCAYELFDSTPFDDVKVSDIAKAAGVSVGAVYYHFASKDDIVDYGYYTFDERLKSYYEAKSPEPGVDGIRLLIDYQVQTVIDMGSHIASITFKNQMEKKNTYLFSKERFLECSLKENVIACDKSDAEAEQIVALILRIVRGTIYDWCTRNGNYDLKPIIREELDMILSYKGIVEDV